MLGHKAHTCITHIIRLVTDHSEVCGAPLIILHLEAGSMKDLEGMEVAPKLCSVCGGEGEHNWEVHVAELKAEPYEA